MPKSSIAITVTVTHASGYSVDSTVKFSGNDLVELTVLGAEVSASARKSAAVPYLKQGAASFLEALTGFNMDPPIREAIAKSVEGWPQEKEDFDRAQAQWDADVAIWKENGSPGGVDNIDPNEHIGHGCEHDPLAQQD